MSTSVDSVDNSSPPPDEVVRPLVKGVPKGLLTPMSTASGKGKKGVGAVAPGPKTPKTVSGQVQSPLTPPESVVDGVFQSPWLKRRHAVLHPSQQDQIRFAREHGIPHVLKEDAEINTHSFAALVRIALEDRLVQNTRSKISKGLFKRVVVLYPRSEEISLYANLFQAVAKGKAVVRGCRPQRYLVDYAEERALHPVVLFDEPTLFIMHDVYFLGPAELYNLCCRNAGRREHRVAIMTYDFRTPGDTNGESEVSCFIGKYVVPAGNGEPERVFIEHITEKTSLGATSFLDHHSRPGQDWEASDNAYGQHEWHHEYLHYSVYRGTDDVYGQFEMTCHVEKPVSGKVLVNVHFRPMLRQMDAEEMSENVESRRLYVVPFHTNYVNSRLFSRLQVAALSIPSSIQTYAYTSFFMRAETLMERWFEHERDHLGKFVDKRNRVPGAPPALNMWTRTLLETVQLSLRNPMKLNCKIPPGCGFSGVAESAAASRIQDVVPMSDALAAAVSHVADKQTWMEAVLLGVRILTELGKTMWRGLSAVWAWLTSIFKKTKGLDILVSLGGITNKVLGFKGKVVGKVNSVVNGLKKDVINSDRFRTIGEWLRAHPILDRFLGVFLNAIRMAVCTFAEELLKKVVPFHVFTAFSTLVEAIDDAWLCTEKLEVRRFLISVVLRGIAHFLLTLLPLPVAWTVHFMFNFCTYLRNVWQNKMKSELSSALDEYLILECGPNDPVEMEDMASNEDFVVIASETVTNPEVQVGGFVVDSAEELASRLREPYSTGGSVAIISSNCTDAFGKPVSDLAGALGVVADRFNVVPPLEVESVIDADYDLFVEYTVEFIQPVAPLGLDDLELYVQQQEFSAGKKEMYRRRIAKLRRGGPITVSLVEMGLKSDEKLPFKMTKSGRWMKMRPIFPMDEVGLWAMAWILPFKGQFAKRMCWGTKFGTCSIYYHVSPTQFNLNAWMNEVTRERGIHVAIHGDDNYIVFCFDDGIWVAAYDMKSCDLTCGPVHQRKHRWYYAKFGMSQEGLDGMEDRAHAPRQFTEFVNGIKLTHVFNMRPQTDTGRPTTSFDAYLMQVPIWIRCFHEMRFYNGPLTAYFAGEFLELFDRRAKLHGVMIEWEETDLHKTHPHRMDSRIGPIHTRSFLGGIFVITFDGYVWCPLTGVKGTCFVRDPRDVWCKDDLTEALWLSLHATTKDKVARINPVTDIICSHYEKWMDSCPTPSQANILKAEKAYRHNRNVYDLARLDDDPRGVVQVNIHDFLLALGEFNVSRGFPDPTHCFEVLTSSLDNSVDVMVRIDEDMSPLWTNARWGSLAEGPWVAARKNRIFQGLDVLASLSGLHKKLLSFYRTSESKKSFLPLTLMSQLRKNQKPAAKKSAKGTSKPKKTSVTPAVRAQVAQARVAQLTHRGSTTPKAAMVAFDKSASTSLSAPMTRPALSKKVDRVNEKVALGNPNKVGSNINKLNTVKNLRTKDPNALGDAKHREALNSIMKCCDPKACLSPDAQRYTALLDRPFDAAWGDEGELPVRPLVYEETVPPTATEVCRQFGQVTISIPAGSRADIFGCVGAGNQQSTYYPTTGSTFAPDGDATGVAQVNVSGIQSGTGFRYCATLGAPNDGSFIDVQSGATGDLMGCGVFGFYNVQGVSALAPTAVTATATFLEWGSASPFGSMSKGDSGAFKYRPIAGGLMITPVDAELAVGGSYDCEIIPNANNDPFVIGAGSGNPYGTSNSISDIWALPDHKITRGDNMFQVNWLPSRLDYGFKRTQGACIGLIGAQASAALFASNVTNAIGVSPGSAVPLKSNEVNIALATVARNARVCATITPPNDGNAHEYVLSYVSFYEVAGSCVQQTATVPRPQPTLGAKVATAVQNDLQQEVEDRTTQVSKGAAFEVMKDHPQIGPMIEKSKDLQGAKSTLTEILDFGKSILPIAEGLLAL